MTKEENSRYRLHGQLTQRADGIWQGSLVDVQGKRRYYYGKSKAAAKRKVDDARKELEQRGSLGGSKQRVDEYLRWWLEEQVRPNQRATTLRGYRVYVEGHIIPALGSYRLDRLRAADVQSFLAAERESGRTVATVTQIRAILRRALAIAQRFGLVPDNVAALTERPKGEKTEITPLDPEEAAKLIAAIRELREGPLYEVAITTGMRLGELLGLRWSDVNLTRRTLDVRQQLQRLKGETVFVPPKTKSGRRQIIMPELTIAALRRQRAYQAEEKLALGEAWTENGLVFTRADGVPRDPSTVSHQFTELVDELGLPHQRFHDLRHLAASLLLAQGHSLIEVRDTLGHASSAITADFYGHLFPEQREGVAAGMDAILARHGVR